MVVVKIMSKKNFTPIYEDKNMWEAHPTKGSDGSMCTVHRGGDGKAIARSIKPEHAREIVAAHNASVRVSDISDSWEVGWWMYPMQVIKLAFAKCFHPADKNAWDEFKHCLAEASREDPLMRRILIEQEKP